MGKVSERFQSKLRQSTTSGDDVRHEWISMKVLQAMRKNGHDWRQAWSTLDVGMSDVTLGDRVVGQPSTEAVASSLEALDFLVASHHGLLQSEDPGTVPTARAPSRHVRRSHAADQVTPAGNIDPAVLADYWQLEDRLALAAGERGTAYWRATTVYARAALIFADHTVSAQRLPMSGTSDGMYANTVREGGVRRLNQTLDWHLRTVSARAREIAWRMSQLTATRQAVGSSHGQLVGLSHDAVENITRMSKPMGRFAWQNRCADALAQAREKAPDRPMLVFNMASTGSGKTRMNARAACVLSRDASPRFSIALNLRSLTLQTGEALKSGLDIGGDELAVVIGDRTAQDLFNKARSAAQAAVFDGDNPDENQFEGEIICDGDEHELPEWMEPLFEAGRERTIVGAPLLVSTIDFLSAAGTPGAQGHHVKALLRLMSADLVLDEIDSYEPNALVAVLRLVQLSALFRRNVICSSATLSWPVATAVERAFRSGVEMLQELERDAGQSTKSPESAEQSIGYVRACIDDTLPPLVDIGDICGRDFKTLYCARLAEIAASIAVQPTLRLAVLQKVSVVTREGWFNAVQDAVQRMHNANAWSFGDSGKVVSFGLVRVANIGTAIEVARHLADALPNASVACYHAGEFRIARFHKERRLDALLSRSRGNEHILHDPEIRKLVAAAKSQSVPCIVVATPVEEIGRDHDFDWGVIEPSSTQSIVQAGGRVNRHRFIPCGNEPNIALLQFNLRHCTNVELGREGNAAFIRPGYEDERRSRNSGGGHYLDHDLQHLLPWDNGLLRVNAALRFDEVNCQLALADDQAVERRVGTYFGEGGFFVTQPVDCWTLTDGPGGPYAKTALRERDAQKQYWRVKDEDGHLAFDKKVRVQDPRGRDFLVDEWFAEAIDVIAARPNAWLALPPADMAQLCADMDIDVENGMQAELAAYKADTKFEYDLGFGVRRA